MTKPSECDVTESDVTHSDRATSEIGATAAQAAHGTNRDFVAATFLRDLRRASTMEHLWRRTTQVVRSHADSALSKHLLLALFEHSPDHRKALFAHTFFRRTGEDLLASIAASSATLNDVPAWQKSAIRRSLDATYNSEIELRRLVFHCGRQRPPVEWSDAEFVLLPDLETGEKQDPDAMVQQILGACADHMGESPATAMLLWVHQFPNGSATARAMEIAAFIANAMMIVIEADDGQPEQEPNPAQLYSDLAADLAPRSLYLRPESPGRYRLLDVLGHAPASAASFPSRLLTEVEVTAYALAFRIVRLTGALLPANMASSPWLGSILKRLEPRLAGDSIWPQLRFALHHATPPSHLLDAMWRWVVSLQASGYFQLSLRILESVPKAAWADVHSRMVHAYYGTAEFEKVLATAAATGMAPKSESDHRVLSASRAAVSLIEQLRRVAEERKPAIVPVENRVLTVLHASLPHQSGGYAVRAHGLLSQLHENGWDVVAYTRPGYPYDLSTHASSADGATESDVGLVRYHHSNRIQRPPGHDESYMLASIAYYREVMLNERPAVVHLRSTFVTALPALIAAKELGIPTVYEVSGLWELVYESTRTAQMEGERARAARFETLVANHADRVVTLTDQMRRIIVSRGAAVDKIGLIPNAVSASLLDDQTASCGARKVPKQMRHFPRGIPVIGYVGSFRDYEGLPLLTSSLRALRDMNVEFRCVLVGDGLTWDRVRSEVENLGLGDWVVMPGRVSHAEVPSWYAAIDISPFPRLRTPATVAVSPLKPFEAMLGGKAVVVSDVSALAEIVNQERGIVVPAGSASALTDALCRLVREPDLRARLGAAARAWVLRERTWSTITPEFESQLLQVIQAGWDSAALNE